MSRIDLKKRKIRIKIRIKRKRKLAKLRQEYLVAKSEEKKEKILEKVSKIAFGLSQEEFLASSK